jgi:anaerobic selenocysteine-containing dehydrogenase
LVVVDPRRTETAEIADEHHFIRPGTDALFLLALLHTVLSEGRANLGRLADHVEGVEEIAAIAARFAPERVADKVGIDARTIRRLAREFASTTPALCYGRVGTCLQEFGTLATWVIDALNLVTGNLDREGGMMFTTPAVDVGAVLARAGQRGSFGAFKSRVRGLPEFGGELPVSVLAEEIETPGEGQIRALVTSCGNPVLSTPNGSRLSRALETLSLMVSVDIYRNETTRHAHFILPPTFALEHEHYGAALHLVAVRNTAKYNEALFAPAPDARHDWQIFSSLLAELVRDGPAGRAASAALSFATRRMSPARILDLLLRTGPHGDRFLPWRKDGLSLSKLRRAPHGVDLGPLVPRLPEALYTETQRIALVPAVIAADLVRLEQTLGARHAETSGGRAGLVLIGRRELRSNNSWMHNSERLVKGPVRCTLRMHPDDARVRGLGDGATVEVRSRVGAVIVPLELSDEVMPGVVSLPHGWGHDREGVDLRVARVHAGASANDLTDDSFVDALSGNAALNGVPVEVTRKAASDVCADAAQ